MTDVIPPATLYSIHPFDQYSNEQNNLWKQLFLLLDQIYLRSGGTVDAGDDSAARIEFLENQVYRLQSISGLLESSLSDSKLKYISVGSAHTTSGNEFVRATASLTVTLNSTPKDGEEVYIQPSDNYEVTISGNINDETEYKIHHAYDVAHLKYIKDAGEWVIQ